MTYNFEKLVRCLKKYITDNGGTALELTLKKGDDGDVVYNAWRVTGLENPPSSAATKVLYDAFVDTEGDIINFNVETAVGRIYEVFATDAVTLAPYFSAIENLMAWKNFAGLKNFINGMVAGSIITAEQKTLFVNILLEQNINLEDF